MLSLHWLACVWALLPQFFSSWRDEPDIMRALRERLADDDSCVACVDGAACTTTCLTSCEVDVVSAQYVLDSPREFVRRFVLRRQPVLIRSLMDADGALSGYRRVWTRKALLQRYGDSHWNVSSHRSVLAFANSSHSFGSLLRLQYAPVWLRQWNLSTTMRIFCTTNK